MMKVKHKLNKEFLRAYDKYASNILKHIYFRTGNWEIAEDLTQETFLKTWNYISQEKKKVDNFKTFTFRVANNLITDYYRRKPRIPLSLEALNANSISIEAHQEKETQNLLNKSIIEKHLSELDENCRQIIIYRYINDLSIKEISKITDKTPNNISVIIHRTLKILKDKLNYTNKRLC